MAHVNKQHKAHQLATEIAAAYCQIPVVEAVVLAGSQTTAYAGPASDIDLYVYQSTPLSIEDRRAIATALSTRAEVNNQFWESGDEWMDTATGIHVDVTFRTPAWIEEQLDRVLVRHEASMGYSTCFWHNVLTSQILFDRNGWFAALKHKADQPYPHQLRHNIIHKNFPVLSHTMSAYRGQLKKAVDRGDWVSVNHRLAALLASYFDVIFAINQLPHPGEKRLLKITATACALQPTGMEEQVNQLLDAGATRGDIFAYLDCLLKELEVWLQVQGLLPGIG